jgi:hypothetical protein
MVEVEKRTVVRGKEPIMVLAVRKVGKTCITLEDGSRWRLRDGQPYGHQGWGLVRAIREYRPGDEGRVAYLQAIDAAVLRLNRVNWRRLPLMALERVEAAIKASEPDCVEVTLMHKEAK